MISVHSVPSESTVSTDCANFRLLMSQIFQIKVNIRMKFVAFRTFNVLERQIIIGNESKSTV